MTSLHLFELVGFVLGLPFGSFLNVCIARLPHYESVVKPGSRCPSCTHPIRWYDNVPVLSWLLLRAHCRDCRASISWRYPAIEIATALWFSFAGQRLWLALHPPPGVLNSYLPIQSIAALAFAVLGFLLIGLIVMDWQTQRLPDAFTITGIFIGFFLVCVQTVFLAPGQAQILLGPNHIQLSSPGSTEGSGNVFLTGPETLLLDRLLAIFFAALVLLLVRWTYKALRHREGMGLGDVKLLAMIAAFLGFAHSILALFFGVLAASAFGVVLVARGRARGATKLPFGSFLAAGGLLAALIGPPLVAWYTSLLR